MLSIGKFAAAVDVGVETVRFYQRKGLLDVPPQEGGIRHYGEEDLSRLKFIRKAQAAGFTLEEIKELITLDSCRNRSRAQELAQARVDALDVKIKELQKARRALKHLAEACRDGGPGTCPILESFGV